MTHPSFVTPLARRTALGILGLAWIAAFAAGTHGALRWESTPGRSPATAPTFAPSGGWRILLVAHPDCPCTAASLRVLAELVAAGSSTLHATVLFVCPPRESANVRLARSIPGLRVEFEPVPDAARDHGAQTSGQTFLLDPGGRVRFAGGLTDGRGVPGRSTGQAAVEAVLAGEPAPEETPVYGCALVASEGPR